ncbi:MAG: glycosyltransferase [Omnitrophica WOR_2 bacterium]|jgi:sugar transferase (PEP-CTERM/EpsH1 system associated)
MKLFIILPRFPYPTEKGDKLRAFNQIKVLSEHYAITLFALSHESVKDADLEMVKPYCNRIYIHKLNLLPVAWNLLLTLFNGRPLQAGYYYSLNAQKRINKIIEELKPDHIYCQLLRTAAYAFGTSIPKTIDYQDVFSKGVERRIPKANPFMKILFKFELKRLQKYEAKVFDIFDIKTIISKPDRDCIPHIKKEEIAIIPNGVDQDYFKPVKTKKISELLFTGNMGYPPNIDCAEYLVKRVLPLIHEKFPETRLTLAGATPHSRVKALASEKVIVTGWVNDIREYYAGSKIFMAPMQLGTGLQNKLLEAMAMKLPCITSTLCNSALRAKENSEILIGNSPEEVATLAIKLMEDQEFADKIALNGYLFIKANYSWKGSTDRLALLMKDTIKKVDK